MNQLEKTDYVLRALYLQTKDVGMLKIIEACASNGVILTIKELQEIVGILTISKYAVFQIEPKGLDYRGQITELGIAFVEIDSFSEQGTSILNL